MTTQIKFFITTKDVSVVQDKANEWLKEADKKGWLIDDIDFVESPETASYVAATKVMVRYREI